MFKYCLHNLFQYRRSGIQLNAALAVSVMLLASFWHTRHGCSQSLFEWINTSGSFYDIGGNWNPVGPPESIDVAQFPADETYEVLWDSITASVTPSVGFVDVGTGNVTFQNQNLTQHSFTINDSLTLFNGAQLSNSGLDLNVVGSTFVINGATLLIEGNDPAGSQFNTIGPILVPDATITFDNGATGNLSALQVNVDSAGTAAINVDAGSLITVDSIDLGNGGSQAASSMGFVNVDGAGSSLIVDSSSDLVVGNSDGLGQHAINVTNGGSLDILLSGGEFRVEDSGSLIIDNGMTSLDQSGPTFIRIDGAATITGGGALDSASAVASIADSADASAQVTASGNGTQWNNTGELVVGLAGDGSLFVQAGAVVNNDGIIAISSFSGGGTGFVSVDGSGSQWNSTGDLGLGGLNGGQGTLLVANGGLVTNQAGRIARFSETANGSVTITGSGSRWENTDQLNVGVIGHGNLLVEAGGVVTNSSGRVGGQASQVTVTGIGSHWTNSADLSVGDDGDGTLNVEAGGLVTNTSGRIGNQNTGTGLVTVTGNGSQWNNVEVLQIGVEGTGTLTVQAAGEVTSNVGDVGGLTSGLGIANITGTGSRWVNSAGLLLGNRGDGTLNIEDGGVVSNTGAIIALLGSSVGVANITGSGSQWNSSGDLQIGQLGNGTLNIGAAGVVSNANGLLAAGAGSTGTANVMGPGSQWNNDGQLTIGLNSFATLNITDGGLVASESGLVGFSGDAEVVIRDVDSAWNNNGSLIIGDAGESIVVNVDSGGQLSNSDATIAKTSDVLSSTVTISGPGSQWINSGNLSVSTGGNAMLNIGNGGLVTVSGTTSIGSNGVVNVDGGRFEFGETSLAEFSRVNAASGSVSGLVLHSDFTNVATIDSLQNPNADFDEVILVNSGVLFGDASLGASLENTAVGEVEVTFGERMRFVATGNSNNGAINLLGGEVRFDQDFSNADSGFVAGFGTLVTSAGLANEGVMAFSSTTVILGDVENLPGGQIVTSGSATTTFFDDVIHNGTEIRTSVGSSTVFFGQASGAGAFTGGGTVFFEGDLRPGNSPDSITFEGDVVMGADSQMVVELAGTDDTSFDRMLVDGNLSLDGALTVELIDGFLLAPEQQFLIAEVAGNLFGQFVGLVDDSLVGTFNGQELFISYSAGDGNDVALYTTTSPTLLGDVNLDGVVNLLDVDPFIERIASGTFQAEADCNQDGMVNLLDVNAFVTILSDG